MRSALLLAAGSSGKSESNNILQGIVDTLQKRVAAGENFHIQIVEYFAFDFNPWRFLMEGTLHL